jgi:hypothetical protein
MTENNRAMSHRHAASMNALSNPGPVAIAFKLALAGILLFTVSCITMQEEYVCVNCLSVALRMQLCDAQDSSWISNAAIIAVNNTRKDTIIVDSASMARWAMPDSAGRYVVYGLPGEYSISISHPLYESFSHDGIYVSQWAEVTCEHANTEHLIIGLERAGMKKKKKHSSSGIISHKTEGHC